MNKINKKIFFPTVLALAVLTVGILSTSVISAQDSSYPTIVERLAERFGLNKDEVQQVFEDEHQERKAEMYANWAERLDDLVAEGKLTETQKQAILDKHEEMEGKIEELKDQNLTFEEKKEKMRGVHEEFKSWIDEQEIDLSLIGPFGMGFKKGFRVGHKTGPMN